MFIYILAGVSAILLIIFVILLQDSEKRLKKSRESEIRLKNEMTILEKKYETSVKERREICNKNYDLSLENFNYKPEIEKLRRKTKFYLDAVSYLNQIIIEKIPPIIKKYDYLSREKEWENVYEKTKNKIDEFLRKARNVE